MPFPIPPADSHYIGLDQFNEMRRRFAANTKTVLTAPYQAKNILVTSELFNVEAINALAAVTGCAAIRVYYGMDDGLKVHALLVAVDANSQDILPPAGPVNLVRGGDPPIVEEGQRCPPFCL